MKKLCSRLFQAWGDRSRLFASARLGIVVLTLVVLGGSAIGLDAAAATGAAGQVPEQLRGAASMIQVDYTIGKQLWYSYLTAFMFFLSICLGSLFLVIVHHLFDAAWSVPVRRFLEQIAASVWILGVLFIPILFFAPQIYFWMNVDPGADHALQVKQVLFNRPAFTIISILLFVIWTVLANRLRHHSLEQDKTGAAEHTRAMRRYAAAGIFIFALSLTLGAIYWMKSIQYAWFSTMYGVYYFAGSVWVTLATAYVIALKLKKDGPLRDVIHKRQIHDLGVLFFAFTVFYAYIHFSQYFLIWNAAIPEETFWYVIREQGSWWQVSLLIVFGHFFLPFLTMLRIDAKLSLTVMGPMAIWAWLMHYIDMQFNVMPALHPTGFSPHLFDVLCFAGIGFALFTIARKNFLAHPPYPQKDPRLLEAITHHEVKPMAAPAH